MRTLVYRKWRSFWSTSTYSVSKTLTNLSSRLLCSRGFQPCLYACVSLQLSREVLIPTLPLLNDNLTLLQWANTFEQRATRGFQEICQQRNTVSHIVGSEVLTAVCVKCFLLRYDAVQSGHSQQFRRPMSLPSSMLKCNQRKKHLEASSRLTSTVIHCYISEDRTSHTRIRCKGRAPCTQNLQRLIFRSGHSEF